MSTRVARPTVAILLLIAGLVIPARAANASDIPGQPVQLELGDSWTYGDGAADPITAGYAGLVFGHNVEALDCSPASSESAKGGCRHLQRVTLARPGTGDRPGVTTDAFIEEQLEVAVALLDSRNGDANPHNDVEVVLMSVGGNDVSGPVLAACLEGLSQGCLGVIKGRLAHVEANLDEILARLTGAAGETEIVITGYDNAIAHCPLGDIPGAAELGALVLEGHPALGMAGLNTVIEDSASRYGVDVAETFGLLGAGDWVGDCLHPNDSGYAKIAAQVSARIDG